jgi:Zinc carboxypeptidase
MRFPTALTVLLAMSLCAAAPWTQTPDLRTRAESSNYEETSRYEDVVRIVNGLASTSPLVYTEMFGRTEEERNLHLMVISDPKVSSPEAAHRLDRPLVFVQANIHAGEVEGKEAILMLARRLVSGDLKPLTRQLVILIAPDYNADGNEKVNVQNRTAQNGPVTGVGTRENAKGLDLNRDYMKLESREARALVQLMTRWDPHVLVDLHTTNGSYHAYHLTYSPILNPNADARLIAFERERLLPAIQAAVLKKAGFRTYYYGNYSPENGGGRESARIDPANPGNTTWRTFDHRPRFGNNYVGLRNRIAILSEAYSYLDFKGRIDVTAAFVEEIWRASADNAQRILSLTSQADRQLTSPTQKAVELGVDFEVRALPELVDIAVGDVKKQLNPRSGKEMSQMTDMAVPVKMKDYGVFEATRLVPMPKGWLIPKPLVDSPRMAAAIDRLKWHGLVMRTISSEGPVSVERFLINEVIRAERPFQGHREARLRGTLQKAQLTVSEGSLFIPANQPLARLAFYLLEPESDDGLVTWNLIEEGLTVGQTYPIYRVQNALPLSFER